MRGGHFSTLVADVPVAQVIGEKDYEVRLGGQPSDWNEKEEEQDAHGTKNVSWTGQGTP